MGDDDGMVGQIAAAGVRKDGAELAGVVPKYPSNVLEGFGAGCLMDFRVRLAIELLKSPMFSGVMVDPTIKWDDAEAGCAKMALNIASNLMALGAERGLVTPLPDDNGELSPEIRAQAKRTASFQALQQIEAQRFAQDEAARVVPMAPSFAPPGGRGRAN